MCSEGDLAPNMERECSECRIEGCLSCSVGDAYECVKCRTGLLLKDGFCKCSTASHKINEDGECGSCEVEGCSSCKSDDPNFCVKCQDCEASLIDGSCRCNFEDSVWNSFGLCTTEVEESMKSIKKKERKLGSSESSGCP